MVNQWSIATVQILIPAREGAEAADYVSETLAGLFPDWAYLKVGGQYLAATEKLIDPETYEEGAAFE